MWFLFAVGEFPCVKMVPRRPVHDRNTEFTVNSWHRTSRHCVPGLLREPRCLWVGRVAVFESWLLQKGRWPWSPAESQTPREDM